MARIIVIVRLLYPRLADVVPLQNRWLDLDSMSVRCLSRLERQRRIANKPCLHRGGGGHMENDCPEVRRSDEARQGQQGWRNTQYEAA